MSFFYYYYYLLIGDSYPLVLLPLGCLQLSLLEVIALDELAISPNPFIQKCKSQQGAGQKQADIFKDRAMAFKETANERMFLIKDLAAVEVTEGLGAKIYQGDVSF